MRRSSYLQDSSTSSARLTSSTTPSCASDTPRIQYAKRRVVAAAAATGSTLADDVVAPEDMFGVKMLFVR